MSSGLGSRAGELGLGAMVEGYTCVARLLTLPSPPGGPYSSDERVLLKLKRDI